MKIQKLSWAGIKIETHGLTLLIDAVEDFSASARFLGLPKGGVLPFTQHTKADFILITHLHRDHYDPSVMRKALKQDGRIVCSTAIARQLAQDGFPDVVALADGQVFERAGIALKPVFSLDGVGDQQVAWVVESQGKRIIHCGDTIWHSHFWEIGKQHEHFDAAFLPINGVVVHFEERGLEFSPVPITLTPLQAVTAGRLLKARKVVPIHYDLFESPTYQPFPNCEAEFLSAAQQWQVLTQLLRTAQVLEL